LNDNYVIHDGQLYHHGIKGQKWGVRRYQNSDGSLTPAGRKRYGSSIFEDWKAKREARAKEKAKARAAAAAKKQESDAQKAEDKVKNAYRKKSASEMTDEELRAAIDRARLEDAYSALRPAEISKGQQFADAAKKLAFSAVESEGKKLIGKLGDALVKKYFPEAEDTLTALKKEKDLLSLKKDIDDLKNPKEKELTWEEKTKKYNLEKLMAEDAAEAQEKAENAKNDAFNETVDTMDSIKRNSRDNASGRVSARTMYNNTKKPPNNGGGSSPKTETYTPGPDDIFGPGSSKRSSEPSGKSTSSDYYDPIIVDFVDKTSNTSSSVVVRDSSAVSSGQKFLAEYSDVPYPVLMSWFDN
jgi:hypothetical protein